MLKMWLQRETVCPSFPAPKQDCPTFSSLGPSHLFAFMPPLPAALFHIFPQTPATSSLSLILASSHFVSLQASPDPASVSLSSSSSTPSFPDILLEFLLDFITFPPYTACFHVIPLAQGLTPASHLSFLCSEYYWLLMSGWAADVIVARLMMEPVSCLQ